MLLSNLGGPGSLRLPPIMAMVCGLIVIHTYFSYPIINSQPSLQALCHTVHQKQNLIIPIIELYLRLLHVILGSHSPFSIHVANSDPATSNPGGQLNMTEVPSNAGLV